MEKQRIDWLDGLNIYEVNIRQYTSEGTFVAFQQHLPRLKDMGVKCLWLMPVTPISAENRKGSLGSPYAAADYTSVNPEFGTLDDFRNLVDAAHSRGMKLIIDWVANHTGWDHTWTKTNPEFYKTDEATGGFKVASGMADIIELDYANRQMREKMIESMRFWVEEFGIDGFRCDLASWVTLDFWLQARQELEKIKPLFFLGEFDELENPEYGSAFDASYTWEWMHRSEDFAKQKLPLADLKNLLHRYESLQKTSHRAWFTSNHDENTWNGTEYEKYGIFAQALAVFSVTWCGIPLIYSGQELPNHKRLEFFEKDAIEWTENCQLHDFYRTLLHLKTTNKALHCSRNQAFEILPTTTEDQLLAYRAASGNGDEVITVLNLSDLSAEVSLEINLTLKEIFTGHPSAVEINSGITMQPGEYLVFANGEL